MAMSMAEEFVGTLSKERRVVVPEKIAGLLGLRPGDLVRVTVMKAEKEEKRGKRRG